LLYVLEDVQAVASVTPPTNSAIPVQAEVVNLWYRSVSDPPAAGFGRVVLRKAGQTTEKEVGKFAVDLTKFKHTRSRLIMSALPVSESGEYEFITQFRQTEDAAWEPVATIPLTVAITVESSKGATA
jgi:hypothetical protein